MRHEDASRRRRRPNATLQTVLGIVLTILLGVGVFWVAYQQMRPQTSPDRFPDPPAPEN